MRMLSAALTLVLLAAGSARAADSCDVPNNLVETFARLPRVGFSVKRDHKLEIDRKSTRLNSSHR